MKTSTAALRDLLYAHRDHLIADLWTVVTKYDGTFWWTSWDQPISYGGNNWVLGPGVVVGDMRVESGIASDDLKVTLLPGPTVLIGTLSLATAARSGRLDGATITLDRAFMLTPGDASTGLVRVFAGKVDRAKPSATEIALTVKTLMAALSEPMPRRLTMAQCPYEVYSTACGVSTAGFTDARTVAAGSTSTVLVLSSASSRATAGGSIKFLSGPLTGITATVRSVAGASVTLTVPLSVTPAVGTSISVIRGCDRTRATCKDVFSNLANFGGFPDTPSSEAA